MQSGSPLECSLSEKYKPFQERARGLGYRALNARQLSDLEHVRQELRTIYARLLGLDIAH